MKQVAADQADLHSFGEHGKVTVLDLLGGGCQVWKVADIDERQDPATVSRHPVRRSLHRALEHLAVDDRHPTAQGLPAADAEVARRPDLSPRRVMPD